MMKSFNSFKLLLFSLSLQFIAANSLWPVFTSISIFSLLMSFYYFVLELSFISLFLSIILVLISSVLWFRDLIRESLLTGSQNFYMMSSLKLGMIFFILSEVFFFISFFWTYFHFMFSQLGELGMSWLPMGLIPVDYMSVPLLNSLLLLSSGMSLTISHHALSLEYKSFNFFLLLTILLGAMFTYCQYWEYSMLDFIFSDSCFSSIFFMGTGFHGSHVIVGSLILLIIYSRSLNINIYFDSMIFEMGAWYWHFVDVIWIILFSEFYWWSYLN